MDVSSEQYRDVMRDVVAMLEQAVELQSGQGDLRVPAENLNFLLDSADTGECLKVAVSMLASAWMMLACVRAAARSTSEAEELAAIFVVFRAHLT